MDEQKIWKSILIEDTCIGYNRKGLNFHTVDRSLLRVVNKAISQKIRLSVSYPVHFCNMVIPFAVEAYYELFEESMKSEVKNKRKVFVVSDNLEIRENYLKLDLAGSPLSNIVAPLGLVSRNGNIKPVYVKYRGMSKRDREYAKDSQIIISTSIKLLPDDPITSDIGVIIVQMNRRINPEDIEKFLDWADSKDLKSIIFISTDPYSANTDYLKSIGFPVWSWTPEILSDEFSNELEELNYDKETYTKNYFLKSAVFIENNIRGIKKKFHVFDQDTRLNELLYKCWDFFTNTIKIFRKEGNPNLRYLAYTFSKQISILEKTIAPLFFVENAEESSYFSMHSLSARLEKIRYFCSKIGEDSQMMAAYAQNAISLYEDIAEYLQSHNSPKSEYIKKVIKHAIENKKRYLIITYRECDSQAVYDYLEKEEEISKESLEEKNILIRKYSDLYDINFPLDKVFICGTMPIRPENTRLTLRLNLSPEIEFLLYPTETTILKKQIEYDNVRSHKEFGLSTRAYALSRLLKIDSKAIKGQLKNKYDKEYSYEKEGIHDESEKYLEKIEDPKLKDVFGEIDSELKSSHLEGEEDWEVDNDSSVDYKEILSSKGDIKIESFRIDFTDGTVMYVNKTKRLPIITEKKTSEEYKTANMIKPDDLIILVDSGARNTVAQELLKRVHEHPKLRDDAVFAKSWAFLLKKRIVEENDSISEAFDKLKEAGIDIKTEISVRFWISGETIGPRNPNNILCIAKAYGIDFLEEKHQRIISAIKRIRSINHKVLRRIKEILLKKGIKAKFEDDLIDEELGLHIEDFSDAISMKRVKSINSGMEVPYNYLNKLLSKELSSEIENG